MGRYIYIGGSNKQIAATETEIMKKIESCCDGGEYQEHFMKNGKWVDDKGLIRFFQDGIKNAKTIEELKEDYFFIRLYGFFSVWKGMDNTIENRVEINSSDDLREFLNTAQNRLDNRTEKEANKYVDKLIEKGFKIDFTVEHITA